MKQKTSKILVFLLLLIPSIFMLSACNKKTANATSISVELISTNYNIDDGAIIVSYGSKVLLSDEDFKVVANLDNDKTQELSLETEDKIGYTFNSTIPNDDITPVGEYKLTFSYLELEDVEIEVKVLKADLDMTSVKWNYSGAYTYDGNKKSVFVTGVPEGVTVSYSGDYAKTSAGKYTAVAKFVYEDSENYNALEDMSLTWEIEKVTIDLTNIDLTSFDYDGNPHIATIQTQLPENVEASMKNGETAQKDAGTYEVSFDFSYTGDDSENFEIISKDKYTWSINAVKYTSVGTISLDNSNFVYNGSVQTVVPNFSDLDENVEVINPTGLSGKDAKQYTAEFTLKYKGTSKNYISDAGTISINWEIARKTLTITAKDVTITYGDMATNRGVEYSGFVANENATFLTGRIVYSYGGYVAGSDVDDYVITPSGVSSDNYDIKFLTGQLIVKKQEVKLGALVWASTTNNFDCKNSGNLSGEMRFTATDIYSNENITINLSRYNAKLEPTYSINESQCNALVINNNGEYQIEVEFALKSEFVKNYYFKDGTKAVLSLKVNEDFESQQTLAVPVSDLAKDGEGEFVYLTDNGGTIYEISTSDNMIAFDSQSTYNASNIMDFEKELEDLNIEVIDGYSVTEKDVVAFDNNVYLRLTIQSNNGVDPQDVENYALTESLYYVFILLDFDGDYNNDTTLDINKLNIYTGSNEIINIDNFTFNMNILSETLNIRLNNSYATAYILDDEMQVIMTSKDGLFAERVEFDDAGTYYLKVVATDGTTAFYTIDAYSEATNLVEVVYKGQTLTAKDDGSGELETNLINENELVITGYLGHFDEVPRTVTIDKIGGVYSGTMKDVFTNETFSALTNVTLKVDCRLDEDIPCISYSINITEDIYVYIVLYLIDESELVYPVDIQIDNLKYSMQLKQDSFDFGEANISDDGYFYIIVEEDVSEISEISISLNKEYTDYSYLVITNDDVYNQYVQNVEVTHARSDEYIKSLIGAGDALCVSNANNRTMKVPIEFKDGLAYIYIAIEGFVGYIPENSDYDMTFVQLIFVIDGVGELPESGGNGGGGAESPSVNYTNEGFEITIDEVVVSDTNNLGIVEQGNERYVRINLNKSDLSNEAYDAFGNVVATDISYAGEYYLITNYVIGDEQLYLEFGDGCMSLKGVNCAMGEALILYICSEIPNDETEVYDYLVYTLYIVFADSVAQ